MSPALVPAATTPKTRTVQTPVSTGQVQSEKVTTNRPEVERYNSDSFKHPADLRRVVSTAAAEMPQSTNIPMGQESQISATGEASQTTESNVERTDTEDTTSLTKIPSTPEQPPVAEPHLDLALHPMSDLLMMLATILHKITSANDSMHYPHPRNISNAHRSSPLLAFHARNVPSISIHAYLTRILKYCPTTNEVFLSLLVYFDRMSRRTNPQFYAGGEGVVQGEQQPVFAIDSYNVHRLIIAGITVASKFFSDVFYTNSRYAKVGGLPLSELNHLELQFLILNDFRLMIPLEELQRYGDQLLRFWASRGDGTVQSPVPPTPQSGIPAGYMNAMPRQVASYNGQENMHDGD
ncbi:cyclin-like protein interacting with PHO85 [Saitoella coloradoensis]